MMFSQTKLPWTLWAWAVLAGLAHGLSMALPWRELGMGAGTASGILQTFSMSTLAFLLLRCEQNTSQHRHGQRGVHWRQSAWLGGLFATAWLLATWGWLYVSLHRYGGLSAGLSVLAILSLAAALALYYAAACAVWAVLWRRLKTGRISKGFALVLGAMGFAALWTLAELMRAQWFTGFPWGAAGYAHVDSLWAAYAPWVGVYGMGSVAAGTAMGLAMLLALNFPGFGMAQTDSRRGPRTSWALGFCLVLLGLALPWALQSTSASWTESAGTMSVRLLQGNIAQDEKFVPSQGLREAIDWYGAQLLANEQSLVVTPETAIPVLPQQLPPAYWAGLRQKFSQKAAPAQLALIGMPMGGPGVGYSNSAVALGPAEANAYRYDKQHLVPFGEFVPPLFQWFVDMLHIPLGDFAQARPASDVLMWQGQRVALQICYEDLFGEELAKQFRQAATAPTVWVNMSNIAWFGDTHAVPQHLNIARMRALEFQRPVLRATNTGATAIIDAQGRVQQHIQPFTRGVLVGEFEGRSGLTPYARWVSKWGLSPLWLLCLAIVLVLTALTWRERPRAL